MMIVMMILITLSEVGVVASVLVRLCSKNRRELPGHQSSGDRQGCRLGVTSGSFSAPLQVDQCGVGQLSRFAITSDPLFRPSRHKPPGPPTLACTSQHVPFDFNPV